LNDLDATLLAHDATMLHALVFTTVTFPIFGRAENLGAEKPITLRLKGPIVDRLRLPHLTMGPFANFRRRCDPNANTIKIKGLLGFFKKFQNAIQTRSSSVKRSEHHPDRAKGLI
jgi:hypothetical protein